MEESSSANAISCLFLLFHQISTSAEGISGREVMQNRVFTPANRKISFGAPSQISETTEYFRGRKIRCFLSEPRICCYLVLSLKLSPTAVPLDLGFEFGGVTVSEK